MCAKRHCKLQLKAGILARNSHTSVASDWTYHFFSHVKKYRSLFCLDVSFFSRVKTIVHSFDWLELICVYFLVSISQYVYNKKAFGNLRNMRTCARKSLCYLRYAIEIPPVLRISTHPNE